jgi:hypothetical protein
LVGVKLAWTHVVVPMHPQKRTILGRSIVAIIVLVKEEEQDSTKNQDSAENYVSMAQMCVKNGHDCILILRGLKEPFAFETERVL